MELGKNRKEGRNHNKSDKYSECTVDMLDLAMLRPYSLSLQKNYVAMKRMNDFYFTS